MFGDNLRTKHPHNSDDEYNRSTQSALQELAATWIWDLKSGLLQRSRFAHTMIQWLECESFGSWHVPGQLFQRFLWCSNLLHKLPVFYLRFIRTDSQPLLLHNSVCIGGILHYAPAPPSSSQVIEMFYHSPTLFFLPRNIHSMRFFQPLSFFCLAELKYLKILNPTWKDPFQVTLARSIRFSFFRLAKLKYDNQNTLNTIFKNIIMCSRTSLLLSDKLSPIHTADAYATKLFCRVASAVCTWVRN